MATPEQANMYLLEWLENYIRHRDIISRKLVSIERRGDHSLAKFKDKEMTCIAEASLEDRVITRIQDTETTIATLSNDANIDWLCNSWDKLVTFQKLTLIFANPFSENDKKWVVKPHVHNKISERKTLKTGFKAMAELVSPITLHELEGKI